MTAAAHADHKIGLVDDVPQTASLEDSPLSDLPESTPSLTTSAQIHGATLTDGSRTTTNPEQSNDLTSFVFDEDWLDLDHFADPNLDIDGLDGQHWPLDLDLAPQPSINGTSTAAFAAREEFAQVPSSSLKDSLHHGQTHGASAGHTNALSNANEKDSRLESESGGSFILAQTDSAHGSTHRNGTRFPRHAVKVLRDWLDTHASNPYPTEQEKVELQRKTQLQPIQISNWLANARRRIKAAEVRRPNVLASTSLPAATAPIAIPGAPNKPWDELNPFERWKNSPPENEPANITDIAQAVANSGLRKQSPPTVGRPKRSSNGSALTKSRPASTASLDTGRTSSVSASTAVSSGSRGSFNSFNSGLVGKRDRRRRKKPLALAAQHSDESKKRVFQCTFCTDTFKSKYDWTRHEKSLHLSLEKWICAPEGPVVVDPVTGDKCAYCDMPNPTAEHIESHDHRQCQDRGLDARVFFRKDHLRQHLRLMHKCGMTPSMEKWKTSAEQINCRCGFCSQRFAVWQQRNDHLAMHFKAGAHMRDWKGCRGLDPAVAVQVTNAMPPYLIGIDSVTPNPFSATNRQQKETCWERLAVRLGAWVTEKARQGVRLTDEVLQAQARIIEYGSDDGWNSTAAENAEWLDLFKKAHGMNYIPGQFGGEGLAIPEDLETYSDLGIRIPFSVQLRAYNQLFEPKPPSTVDHARDATIAQQLRRTCERLAEQDILQPSPQACPHIECEGNQIDIALLSAGQGAAHSLFCWCTHQVSPDTQDQLQACILAARSPYNLSDFFFAPPLPLSAHPETGVLNRKPYLQRHRYELPANAAQCFASTTGMWPDSGSMPPGISTDELLQQQQQQMPTLPPATSNHSPMDASSGHTSQSPQFNTDLAAGQLPTPTLHSPADWTFSATTQDQAAMAQALQKIYAETTTAATDPPILATDVSISTPDTAAMTGIESAPATELIADDAVFDNLEIGFDDVFDLSVDDNSVVLDLVT